MLRYECAGGTGATLSAAMVDRAALRGRSAGPRRPAGPERCGDSTWHPGSQYTGARYRAKAEAANIRLSMSRPGLSYDNGMAESFFDALKHEIGDYKPFAI